MSILIKLSTTFRDVYPNYDPQKGIILEYNEGLTVKSLAEKLNLPLAEIKIIMINGCQVKMSQTINKGDRIAYFPPVGGG